ncbi:hypothetical protein SS50377_27125 [Spironucleus salmonicida]|uniref:Uncharacterized protein n=1 Tax=Spironucleus salmonicida TaxID=348837 RepID=A0A9P8LMK1_9EUKA|nr:hypothetical protein SS50377_27123 [Spironucleus salmonicida]KAH0570833.1 hypothetical protein SS50377_27125 [Spironucleus salmonicida]
MLSAVSSVLESNRAKQRMVQNLAAKMPILQELSANESEVGRIAAAIRVDAHVVAGMAQFARQVYTAQ